MVNALGMDISGLVKEGVLCPDTPPDAYETRRRSLEDQCNKISVQSRSDCPYQMGVCHEVILVSGPIFHDITMVG